MFSVKPNAIQSNQFSIFNIKSGFFNVWNNTFDIIIVFNKSTNEKVLYHSIETTKYVNVTYTSVKMSRESL